MDEIKLSSITPSLIIHEEESLKSIRIVKLIYRQASSFASGLSLNILDEKDIPIYSMPLNGFKENETQNELEVNQEFAIWNHLTVNISAEKENSDFEIVVVLA